ncbi:hypothetical protein Cgig2_004935 [Carnegiea gigantea]|uniref:Aminotransferase-like plant mobile domain-containing protein n=1 Tax=Carnegiea gigantea TaxID=171969 RepID=A0A9Q1KZM9_9CARY|nr:hypothetical protein Cgig2_004935 [Carnegiea gigantea]
MTAQVTSHTTQFSLFLLLLQGLFEIITFMDKTTNGRRYLHIQPSENDVDGEETKLPIRNSITSLCKSDYIGRPPSLSWWDKDNLKAGETFLLSSHVKVSKGKQTIEQWIAFWFRGRNKYHISRKSDKDNRIPHPGILFSIIDAGARGWVRDAGCISSGTFSVPSFMASGVGYCLPKIILASLCKGLNENSRSSHPGRGGSYFPAHFLYAWLAKNFDAYELAGEASSSPGMVKFSGLGQVKLFQLKEARELIGSRRGFHWHSSTINRLKETLVDDGKLSRADFAYFVGIRSDFVSYRCEDSLVTEHYCLDRFSRQFGFHQDVPADLDFDNLPDPETMLRYHQMLTHYGTGSSRVKILGIDVIIPTTPIPAIPIRSIASLLQDKPPIEVCGPSTEKVTELPPESAENIMDILDTKPNPIECMDLQQSYSGRTSAEEHDSCRMEVQGKLDEASRWLNTEGAHYEAKTAELK